MKVFLVSLGVFLGVILLMGIGVLFRRRPLSGSCGGLNNALQDEQGSCQICGAQVDESCKNKIESYDTPRKLD